MKLVGVDIGAKHIARHLFVFAQQGRAGKADEDGSFQPALHLLVHVAALAAVAFVHKHVHAAMHRRRRAIQVRRVNLVEQRTHQPCGGGAQLLHKLCPRGDTGRGRTLTNHARIAHHACDLLVQLVAVCHHQNARLRVVLQQPLGQQHHQYALAAALGVPDHAALALGNALLCRLDPCILVRARYLLLPTIEDEEIANQVQQPGFVAKQRQRLVQQCSGSQCLTSDKRNIALPRHKKLLGRASGTHAQALRVIACQHHLHGAEKTYVENLFLVGDELAHAVSQFYRAALELKHHHGDAVDVEHNIWPPLVAPLSVTSSARAKSFFSGFTQSIKSTVLCTPPATT